MGEQSTSPRAIRWRKGELIGVGAYGRVYMGMNLDSGELIAVKQVLIAASNFAKGKAQLSAHIRELEEEVKLLQNLSHPNIVRYLGTAREEEALNIFLEFVPGGSISSLLGKFGSFTEPVIRMYTRQLLLGLEYLHQNKIMHRDIKGANILVDNQGHIKVADFGASKKVLELATISEAKSMKGTPYWMAPEVVRQTGHNWQADIWSVGCTVIEMATGKPPWSDQFQEVAALFHIGTTKSHPPIPEHLSPDAKSFLLKCLQREPRLRPTAAELLKHPFVSETYDSNAMAPKFIPTVDDCQLRKSFVDDLNCSVRLDSPCASLSNDEICPSFNPVSEPSYVEGACWTLGRSNSADPVGPSSHTDDDDVTESKIKAFLEAKASELAKLQTPLYEEYSLYKGSSEEPNSSFVAPLSPARLRPPTASRSPSKGSSFSERSTYVRNSCESDASVSSDSAAPAPGPAANFNPLLEVRLNGQDFPPSIRNSSSFCDRQRQWKEELQQELEMKREEKRKLARHASGATSPLFQRQSSRLGFSPVR
ncbi:mitogen-activated protein kinase kinase kinase 2 [Selaginella moellendorffii]|uniref:mitogen-activated protein kinase kinase kinase 2 n=1 Tax=Selaginella moellendorffii TaxID=88036 RepID=UPI000D1CE5C6|nr:mitogen-activated protein kinase kinase kinase 2 [Selaginella moellendorffii]|eukprot:XP_002978306.2 mitogen-activated protein kinase kinase kinase 2 [Selaginella moellendorffii]